MYRISLIYILLAPIVFIWGCDAADNNNLNVTTGTGGSMATFTLAQDHLYIADGNQIKVIDVTDAGNPVAGAEITTDSRLETIFPADSLLFLGTPNGMLIYSLADPANPQYQSFFQHFFGCDPVVVQGDYAYVTVRADAPCRAGQDASQLYVVDVSDPVNPIGLIDEEVITPYGLGVSDSLLFLCRGDNGLELFHAFPPDSVVSQIVVDSIHAWDVIPHNQVLLVTGEDGIFQYDFTDPYRLTLLSQLPE